MYSNPKLRGLLSTEILGSLCPEAAARFEAGASVQEIRRASDRAKEERAAKDKRRAAALKQLLGETRRLNTDAPRRPAARAPRASATPERCDPAFFRGLRELADARIAEIRSRSR